MALNATKYNFCLMLMIFMNAFKENHYIEILHIVVISIIEMDVIKRNVIYHRILKRTSMLNKIDLYTSNTIYNTKFPEYDYVSIDDNLNCTVGRIFSGSN